MGYDPEVSVDVGADPSGDRLVVRVTQEFRVDATDLACRDPRELAAELGDGLLPRHLLADRVRDTFATADLGAVPGVDERANAALTALRSEGADFDPARLRAEGVLAFLLDGAGAECPYEPTLEDGRRRLLWREGFRLAERGHGLGMTCDGPAAVSREILRHAVGEEEEDEG